MPKPQDKRPWPADAVMIVAAFAGEEIRAQMEGVYEAYCRVCSKKLYADTFTLRLAEELPDRRGRPIKYFCIPCATEHDADALDVLIDCRPVALT